MSVTIKTAFMVSKVEFFVARRGADSYRYEPLFQNKFLKTTKAIVFDRFS